LPSTATGDLCCVLTRRTGREQLGACMNFRTVIAAAIFAAAAPIAYAQEAAPENQSADTAATEDAAAAEKWAEEFLARLDHINGEVKIGAAKATLTVPDEYYFLDAEDARAVLEEAWGNPPDEATLGMLVPVGMTPLDTGAWAAILTYDEDGYVSDEDATGTDYDDLMKSMKSDMIESSKWREENGYGSIDLIGWAEPPSYNSETHKLYWAKELKFGGAETNTLNYDIRVLGRHGVLVVRFVADMASLPEIKAATPEVLDMASFDAGSRYADYQKGVDKMAGYGIAGLIAGGAIAKKTGLLAAVLLFGKKFIAIIIAGLAAAGAWLKRQFARKP